MMIRWMMLATLLTGVAFAADKKDEKGTVHIKDLKYDPKEMHVKVGETVTWINDDDKDHAIESDDGSFKNSENLSHGEKYKLAFKKKGRYEYHCKYHPREKGVIIVE